MPCTKADHQSLLITQISKPGKWSHTSVWWVFHFTQIQEEAPNSLHTSISEQALDWGYSVDFCEPDTNWKFEPYELEKYDFRIINNECNNRIDIFLIMIRWFFIFILIYSRSWLVDLLNTLPLSSQWFKIISTTSAVFPSRRNKHGVPHQKIAQMMDRFTFPISIDIVMASQEPLHVNQRTTQQKQAFR